MQSFIDDKFAMQVLFNDEFVTIYEPPDCTYIMDVY